MYSITMYNRAIVKIVLIQSLFNRVDPLHGKVPVFD